ncbi:Neprilysin-11 [Hypsibius exemplaris]|uniref:Neprilysin-11 n=1 Tax=Hypsibius exemplaris TaxID=2072580 RepID=A0A1W0WRT5_HYPEX|nr:Neprilysin-11 [Hypsibius exemplaris]
MFISTRNIRVRFASSADFPLYLTYMSVGSHYDPTPRIPGRMSTKTKMKTLVMLLFIMFLVTITFILLYVTEVSKAAHLNKVINRDANPCDDFYEFACGGWNRTEPMPDDKARWGAFDLLNHQMVRDLKSVLTRNQELPVGAAASATEKMQKYFQTCLDTDSIEQTALIALEEHVKQDYAAGLETWPFLSAIPTLPPVDVAKVVSTAFKYGNSLGLFTHYIAGGLLTPETNVINFDTGRFTLNRFWLLSPDATAARAAYVQYGAEVAMLLAAAQGRSDVTAEVATALFGRILAFEIELAMETLTPQETWDEHALQHLMPLSSFSGNYTASLGLSAEKWVEIFKGAWPDASSNLTVETVVNVREIKYFAKLNLFAASVNTDKSAVLSNYLAWKVVEPLVTHLGAQYREAYQTFAASVYGIAQAPPRVDFCLSTMGAQFPNAVGSLYVSNFLRKTSKAELQIMTDYIIKSFRDILRGSLWMTEGTRQLALAKANKLTARLAYDDYLMDNLTMVDTEHASFVAQDGHLPNFLGGRRFATQVQGRLFSKVNARTDWIAGAAVVNAFYSPMHNSISILAGMLQPPFFGADLPHYVNFAAIGSIIGHEITHGFDLYGSQRDGDGHLINWWDSTTLQAFYERAQPFIDQYNGFNFMGVQLIGAKSQSENVADSAGIKQAYRAYRLYRKEQLNDLEEPHLPSFETFSSEQMFYLSYAQMWCGDYRREEAAIQVFRAHSPGKFRVIGPLQNSETFAQAYSCANSTYMNHANKLAVW